MSVLDLDQLERTRLAPHSFRCTARTGSSTVSSFFVPGHGSDDRVGAAELPVDLGTEPFELGPVRLSDAVYGSDVGESKRAPRPQAIEQNGTAAFSTVLGVRVDSRRHDLLLIGRHLVRVEA